MRRIKVYDGMLFDLQDVEKFIGNVDFGFTQYFSKFIYPGFKVINGHGDELNLEGTSPPSAQVRLNSGRAIAGGYPVDIISYQLINILPPGGGDPETPWGNGGVTADNTHPRHDLICIKHDYKSVNELSKWFLDTTGEDPVEHLQTVHTEEEDSFDIVVARGTPSESPSDPDVPAGYTAIWRVIVPANASSISNFNDLRVFTQTPYSHQESQFSGIHGSTNLATANRLVHRDSSGRARFASPSNSSDAATKGYVDGHTGNTSNPHNVTNTQVGLGNVTNNLQATKAEFDTHVGLQTSGIHGSTHLATANKLVHRDSSGRARFASPSNSSDAATKGYVDGHTGNTSNPHNVTNTQVGLGNVTNNLQATKAEFDTHVGLQTSGIHGSTHLATANKLVHRDSSGRARFASPSDSSDAATKGYVDGHTGNTSNPHNVTNTQVGLGNVTNNLQATKTEFDTHVGLQTSGIHGSTHLATANKLVHRDSGGRARFASPSNISDAATKGYVDTHVELQTSGIHGSTRDAFVNKLVHRDSSGRARFASPSHVSDAATKGYVDGNIAGIEVDGKIMGYVDVPGNSYIDIDTGFDVWRPLLVALATEKLGGHDSPDVITRYQVLTTGMAENTLVRIFNDGPAQIAAIYYHIIALDFPW